MYLRRGGEQRAKEREWLRSGRSRGRVSEAVNRGGDLGENEGGRMRLRWSEEREREWKECECAIQRNGLAE